MPRLPFVITARVWLAAGLAAATAAAQPADDLTDERLAEGIQVGVQWLLDHQKEGGHWEKVAVQPDIEVNRPVYWPANTALACLALLYAGIPAEHPKLNSGLHFLLEAELNATYVIGLRCHVMALAPRQRFREACARDLKWLLRAVGQTQDERSAGTYSYTAPRPGQTRGRYDNSNSQYGVLGVWAAAEAGHKVPDLYWQLVEHHWLADQQPDGGWNYRGGGQQSYGSMTAAGLATLYVVLDHRYADRAARSRHEAVKPPDQLLEAIDRGLDWLGRHYRADGHPPRHEDQWLFYYLYGVERVGHASGRKYFNDRDWFREGAREILKLQMSDGGWPAGYGIPGNGYINGRIVNTAFALMFLTRGSGPILFNKLERPGVALDWNVYPRDLAYLARFAERTLERHVNWQVVSLTAPVESLHDAPVLYVSGSRRWDFTEAEIRALRAYLRQGGLIFAVASGPGTAFPASIERLTEQICPEAPLRPIESHHPLFTQRVHVAIERPFKVLEAHNGIRPLVLLCTQPVSRRWQGNDPANHADAFALGTNVYLYAADRSVRRSRLTTHILPNLPPPNHARAIRVARIAYDGRWDPEPFGWEQLRREMAADGVADLQVTVRLRWNDARLQAYDIAHVTGTGRFTLSQQELAAMRGFLEGGGTLLADAAGGREDFDATFRARLREAFPAARLRAVPLDHRLWTGLTGGADLRTARTRRTRSPASTGAMVGRRGGPRLEALYLEGRLAVIYSPIDLSAGMVGQPIFECPGLRPSDARRLMRNMLLYAEGLANDD